MPFVVDIERQIRNNKIIVDMQILFFEFIDAMTAQPVSYTHLDVYKRQVFNRYLHSVQRY